MNEYSFHQTIVGLMDENRKLRDELSEQRMKFKRQIEEYNVLFEAIEPIEAQIRAIRLAMDMKCYCAKDPDVLCEWCAVLKDVGLQSYAE